MDYLIIILLGISLSMDAFAISICDGLCLQDINKKRSFFIAGTFGFAQGLMPLIGFVVGSQFMQYISEFDHWIAFSLLFIIGGKMIYDAIKELRKPEELQCSVGNKFSVRSTLFKAVATSIDALAVGISLSGMNAIYGFSKDTTNIFIDSIIIMLVTFLICLVGVLLGKKINSILKNKYLIFEIIGGLVLLLIGANILLEHLGVIAF